MGIPAGEREFLRVNMKDFTDTMCVCVCMHLPSVSDLCVEQNTMATVSAGVNPDPALQRKTGDDSLFS